MKFLRFLPPFILSFIFSFQSYPHVESTVHYRITNRRFISHIVFELKNNIQYITIIASHPTPWNLYAKSYPLYYRCRASCLPEMEKLNAFLDTGYNIGLKLNGSYVEEIIYYDP